MICNHSLLSNIQHKEINGARVTLYNILVIINV